MEEKKIQFNAIVNNVDKSKNDPTAMNVTFLVHDFEVSYNNGIISEEVCAENMHTLLNKPIVAKYISQSENNGIDGLKGHESTTGILRNSEKEIFATDTIAIGTITNTYIDTYEKDGESKRALFADALLWLDKYPNICDLLVEWHNRGIQINTSMELIYNNYSMVDGVTNVLSPFYYTAHCLLQSEDKSEDGLPLVLPAYDDSQLISFNEIQQFNKLVAQAINQEEKGGIIVAEIKENEEVTKNDSNKEEQESEQQVQMNSLDDKELSLYEIGGKIRKQLETTDENTWIWVSDVYQTYAIVSVETTESYTHYKYDYTITDGKVTVDLESKVEVEEERKWVKVEDEMKKELASMTKEKEELLVKYNSANETILSLNSQLKDLKPYKEQHLQAQRESKLTEQKEFYSGKFEAIGASDVFESEDVQSLLLASIEDGEKGLEAKRQLLEKLVESVKPIQVEKVESESPIVQMSSKRGTLLETKEQDFDAKYSI